MTKIWKGKRVLLLLLAVALLVTMLPPMEPLAFSEEMGEKPSTEDYKKYIGCDAWFVGYSTPLTNDPETAGNPLPITPFNAYGYENIKLVIEDCYYDATYDALWYKVKAAPGYTLPNEVALKPWVFQDYVLNPWGACLKIAEPETVSNTVTDSNGNPILGSDGQPLTVTVSGGLPEGAELKVSVPQIDGKYSSNLLDIKVLAPNSEGRLEEWQPINEGRKVTISIPIHSGPNVEYVNILHYIDHADAIQEGITYVSTEGADSAVLEAFADAITTSDREGYVAVEKFDKVLISSGVASIQVSSFSIYEWTETGYQKIPGTGDVTEVLFRNDQISATNRQFEYWASPGQTFMLTTATGSWEDDPFSALSEDITLVNTRGDFSGLFTGHIRHATVTILDTAQVGSDITINFQGTLLSGEIIIHIIREVYITFDKNLSEANIGKDTYGPVATDGIKENLFTIPTSEDYIPVPTDDHYTFMGWSTMSDGTGDRYMYDKTTNTFTPSAFTPSRNMTLYAMWSSENSIVKFDPNGGIGTYEQQVVKTGEKITLPAGPERQNYRFLGWSATKDGYSTPYAAGAEYTVNQDTTLHAIWGVDLTITVSGGTELLLQKEGDFDALPLDRHTYINGQKIFLNDPVTENGVTTYTTVLLEGFLKNARFTFKYASMYKANEPAANGAMVDFTKQTNQIIADIGENGINVNTSISFSAVPQGEKSFIVSYDTNFGTPVASTVLKGLENHTLQLTELPTTTRPGYTFVGWYLDEALTQIVTVPMVVTSNITLYAKWEVNSYTVTWIVDGKETVVTYEYGATIVKPADPTKTGYTFTGWNGYTAGMTMPAGDVTFAAQFEINKYTIKWLVKYGNNEEVVYQIKLEYGAAVNSPTDPVRDGYRFKGWDQTPPATMPDSDVTITATLTAVQYTVKFRESNGNYVAGIDAQLSFTIENPPLQIPNPMKEGHTFKGWYAKSDLSGEPYNLLTLVQALQSQNDSDNVELTVYAKWDVNQYTVTWIIDGVETEVAYDYGATIVKPADPVKDGYTFTGWDGYTAGMTMPAKNLEFTAKFEQALTTLTIQLTGCNDPDQAFIFTVESIEDGVDLKVTVKGSNSVTIQGVTIGNKYTVTIDNDWSWRYESKPESIVATKDADAVKTANNSITVTLEEGEIVTFNMTSTNLWLDGNDYHQG